MGDTDIISDIDTSAIVKVATEIDDSIFAYTHLTYMEELAFSMDARFAPPELDAEQSQVVVAKWIRDELVSSVQKFHQEEFTLK